MPEITIEGYDDLISEIRPLLVEHWAEIAVYKDMALDPDFATYKRAADAGRLVNYAVWDNGNLIGYAIFFLTNHPHYRKTLWARNDLVWLAPQFRNFGVGKALVEFWEADLKARQVDVIHVNSKLAHPALASLLRAFGYADIEVSHQKRLK